MRASLRLPLSALLVALAALTVFAASAAAAPKEIAYVCKGEDICLLDPDNPGDVVNLTDNGTTSFESDPVWSPDGKRLAFVAEYTSKLPQEENIFTMEPDATGNAANIAVQVTHFTNGLVATTELAWSPDGSKVAFVRGGASAGSNPVYVVNSDGSSASATNVGVGLHPTWSPDSAKIAFSRSNQVYLVNPDLSSPATPLTGATGEEPAWSPDGSKIAYGREFQNIQIIGSGGGTPLTLTSSSQFAFASWSPSGAELAYHEQEGGGNSYFQIVNADGSGKHHLPIVQGLNANGPAPSWSPDGSRMVFQGFYFGEPSTEADNTNEVYIANSNGTGSATSLTPNQGVNATDPAWRPNPVTNPGPQVFTPSQGGSTAPLPGPTIKPQTRWFTNRIPWTPGPPYVPMLIVVCGGPSCGGSGVGKMKGAVPAGLVARPAAQAATASAKPKKPKKSGGIVVARGKVQVPAGQQRTLKLKLTKLAIEILEKVGKLKMAVTVTITTAGQKPVVETRTVEVFLKPPSKAKHHEH